MFISAIRCLFAFLPAPFQLFILAVVGFILLAAVFKFIAFVLNSIPFL